MVGSAIVRELGRAMPSSLILVRSREELDLTNQEQVSRFLRVEKPDYIFVAAARVGGIHANDSYRAEFLYENLMIEANLIHGAYREGVRSLMFLGSSCIYPRNCPQPIKEEYLLTGSLESTNEAYAVAKIAGLKLCESYNRQYGTNFISLMPTNLYGPGDNYDLLTSHVLPALILKTHRAITEQNRELVVWGSGLPRREFLYVDDLASACVYFMTKSLASPEQFMQSSVGGIINIGTGKDLTIAEAARLVSEVLGFDGDLVFDRSKSDGTPRKLLDVSRANALGWRAKVALADGIRRAYQDFCERKFV